MESKQLKEDLNYCDATKALIREQKINWEQCKMGYATLDSVQVKTFQFQNCSIKVQFNPGRLISTSAKVDVKSIKERKCFLCKTNLPEEQSAIEYKDDFLILVNPFPIFPEHFTLPSLHHINQNIENSFAVMLDFSKDLSPDFTVFYNGPRCGASAPDHLHFQAGTKNFMTIDHEYLLLREKVGEKLFFSDSLSVDAVNDDLRKMVLIEGCSKSEVEKSFQLFYSSYKEITKQTEEPMMNVLSSYQNERWQIIIFLREKHRPQVFFEEDETKKIMLSPAAVDIGGVCILPREEDFIKLTQEKLQSIFHEVFIDEEIFEELKIKLRNEFIRFTHSDS